MQQYEFEEEDVSWWSEELQIWCPDLEIEGKGRGSRVEAWD